jgi:hypothetical protein
VLELPLGGGSSNAPVRSGIMIKFTFTAEPHGDTNANELQATDAIIRATATVSALRPTPQIVGQVDLVIGTGAQVATEVQTFENTWNVLLQQAIDLFEYIQPLSSSAM